MAIERKMEQDILSFPAVKLFASTLSRAEYCDEKQMWSVILPHTNKRTDLHLVWLQGNVQNTLQEGVSLLTDGTGRVKLLGCNKLPDKCDWLKQNEYCLALGKIRSVSKDGIEIKTFKLSSLENNKIHQSIWRQEVQHLTSFLSEQPD